jgi:hypothetical protein
LSIHQLVFMLTWKLLPVLFPWLPYFHCGSWSLSHSIFHNLNYSSASQSTTLPHFFPLEASSCSRANHRHKGSCSRTSSTSSTSSMYFRASAYVKHTYSWSCRRDSVDVDFGALWLVRVMSRTDRHWSKLVRSCSLQSLEKGFTHECNEGYRLNLGYGIKKMLKST